MHIEHFTYGLATPVLAYAVSVIGSLLGLAATARARTMVDRSRRARWLLLAAWPIGGTGIWVMHFVAMMGFGVADAPVRYDIPTTVASWILAMVVVAIGLFIVGFGRVSAVKIVAAGVLTGIGVAGMHYTGMSAMRTSAVIAYDGNLVAASIGIAMVAATVALWFTVTLRRGPALVIAALVMGVAVSGMHYTGMFAMRVTDIVATPIEGELPIIFIGPIVLFMIGVIVVLLWALLNGSGEPDRGAITGPIVPSVAAPQPSPARHRTAASAFIRPRR